MTTNTTDWKIITSDSPDRLKEELAHFENIGYTVHTDSLNVSIDHITERTQGTFTVPQTNKVLLYTILLSKSSIK